MVVSEAPSFKMAEMALPLLVLVTGPRGLGLN
jgi:hypothetical protein